MSKKNIGATLSIKDNNFTAGIRNAITGVKNLKNHTTNAMGGLKKMQSQSKLTGEGLASLAKKAAGVVAAYAGFNQVKAFMSDCVVGVLELERANERLGTLMKNVKGTTQAQVDDIIKYGFSDVTSKIALSTGLGLKRGDVLLNTTHHTALVVEDGGKTIVNASINEKGKTTGGKSGDQTGREIYTRGYYNYPWNVVLRYNESSSTAASVTTSTKEDKDYSLSDSFGTGGNTVGDKFSASADATYKLIVGGNDITSYVGNLSWQNSIDELATKMSFEAAKSDTNYVNTYAPQIGDIVNFCTNIEIFRGIVIAVDDGDKFKNKYTVTDFGWYDKRCICSCRRQKYNGKRRCVSYRGQRYLCSFGFFSCGRYGNKGGMRKSTRSGQIQRRKYRVCSYCRQRQK